MCHALSPQGVCTSHPRALNAFLPGLQVAGSVLALSLSLNGTEASALPDTAARAWPGSHGVLLALLVALAAAWKGFANTPLRL